MTENFPGICVDIYGGLGNQMFQYAAGLSLAARLGVPLVLNCEGLTNDHKREYSLDVFAAVDQPQVDAILPDHRWWDMLLPQKKRERKRRRRMSTLARERMGVLIHEPFFHYWEGFETLKAGTHLHGYWQSPKYFAAIEARIRNCFILPQLHQESDIRLQEDMSGGESVSVHLRRGDYTDPNIMRVHGLCKRSYYDQARRIMEALHPSSTFYIFSDDTAAARVFFQDWSNAVFVDQGAQERDLLLMTCCRRHIIANSSFSWWGAWLATAGETVIAPRQWFARETLIGRYVLDLLPEQWILA